MTVKTFTIGKQKFDFCTRAKIQSVASTTISLNPAKIISFTSTSAKQMHWVRNGINMWQDQGMLVAQVPHRTSPCETTRSLGQKLVFLLILHWVERKHQDSGGTGDTDGSKPETMTGTVMTHRTDGVYGDTNMLQRLVLTSSEGVQREEK